nr:hypothetical protein MF5294_00138 [Mycoplasma feriruminatoris]
MWCGITNDKQKIYFYDKKESYMENDVALIAINKNAISNVN